MYTYSHALVTYMRRKKTRQITFTSSTIGEFRDIADNHTCKLLWLRHRLYFISRLKKTERTLIAHIYRKRNRNAWYNRIIWDFPLSASIHYDANVSNSWCFFPGVLYSFAIPNAVRQLYTISIIIRAGY